MKINKLLIIICILLLNACVPRPAFAPLYTKMPSDPYGSSIIVRHHKPPSKNTIRTEGELIAIENDSLIILTNENFRRGNKVNGDSKILKIDQHEVKSFILHYAKTEGGRAYMISTAMIPLHGFFMLLTLPLNLIFILVTDGSEAAYFSLKSERLPFDQLYKYARFPQGLPEGLDVNDLEPRID